MSFLLVTVLDDKSVACVCSSRGVLVRVNTRTYSHLSTAFWGLNIYNKGFLIVIWPLISFAINNDTVFLNCLKRTNLDWNHQMGICGLEGAAENLGGHTTPLRKPCSFLYWEISTESQCNVFSHIMYENNCVSIKQICWT